MTRIRFTAAYDGRPYLGWQSQPGGRTVQDVLEPEQLYYMLFGLAMAQLGMGGDGLPAQEGDDEEADEAEGADAADEDDQFQPE